MNTLIHNGNLISVFPEVLEELGLIHGQIINTEIFWRVIALNANIGLAKIETARTKEKNMAYKPKTADQIFLTNVLVRLVENHLHRRKIRGMVRKGYDLGYWNKQLEEIDNRIALLTRSSEGISIAT